MRCLICGSNSVVESRLPDRPIISQFNFPGTIEELYGMVLVECGGCNFMQLKHNIPPEKFYTNYSTPSSWKPIPHSKELIKLVSGLISDKRGRIVEIGSNDGSFLKLLQQNGYTSLTGIEPSWEDINDKNLKLDVIPSYFDSPTATELVKTLKVDLVISRHVLEHVWELHDFMSNLRTICNLETKILIEVPDSETFIRGQDISFWEEHCNYFSKENLIQLFDQFGFELITWQQVIFSGLAQLATFRVKNSEFWDYNLSPVQAITHQPRNIGDRIVKYRNLFRCFIQENVNNGAKIFLLGSGSRSLGFLWTLGSDAIGRIDFFLDSNPMKVSKQIPGTDKVVLPIEYLKESQEGDLILLGVSLEDEERVTKELPAYVRCLSVNWPSMRHWLRSEF
jgi:hypothetical protein